MWCLKQAWVISRPLTNWERSQTQEKVTQRVEIKSKGNEGSYLVVSIT